MLTGQRKGSGSGLAVVALASALVALGACEQHLSAPSGPSPDQILAVDAVQDSMAANGVSESEILIQLLLAEFRPNTLDVTVRTTAGLLIGGAATGSEVIVKVVGGRGSVHLRSSNQAETARVTASANGIAVTDTIEFVRAGPSGIRLETATLTAAPDGVVPIDLTATVKVDIGKPTLGTEVRFVAEDLATGVEVRELRRESTTGDDGKVTAQLRSLRALDLRVMAYPIIDVAKADTVLVRFE